MRELEVKQLILDALAEARQQMPANSQDDEDGALAEHYFLKVANQAIGPRLKKIEDNLKKLIKEEEHDIEINTDNYHRYPEYGTPRNTFDAEAFITAIVAEFNIPKHKLVELKGKSTKTAATPISIVIEYKEK